MGKEGCNLIGLKYYQQISAFFQFWQFSFVGKLRVGMTAACGRGMKSVLYYLPLCRLLLSLSMFSLLICSTFAKEISLSWDPSPDPDIVGYVLYFAPANGNQYQRVEVGAATSRAIAGLQPGTTYQLFSTAVNSAGAESRPSNVVLFRVPDDSNLLQNGSFEDDFNGWSAGGHLSIHEPDASNGRKSMLFNYGQREANGLLSQRFSTEAGRSYTVSFDLGSYSVLFKDDMMMVVSVKGNSVLAAQSYTTTTSGTGFSWTTTSFNFTADSAKATLLFQDASVSTDSVDLLLDNVRVTADPL